jgi:hypothetical protein
VISHETDAVEDQEIHNEHDTGYARSAYAAYGNAMKRNEGPRRGSDGTTQA